MANALKNYEYYADLRRADNPQADPDGVLLRAVGADDPPWCVSGLHGDKYLHTLEEVKNYCQGYTFKGVK